MFDEQLSKLWMNEPVRCEVVKKNFKDMAYGTHHTRDKQNILPL
jgi:hypothetical protein